MTPALRSRPSSVRRDTDGTVVLVRGDVEVASWPLARWGCPDLAVVDGLARLQLLARRLGCSIQLRDPGVELRELLEAVGLGDVVTDVVGLPAEVRGEAEGSEQVRVDEVVMPDDPIA